METATRSPLSANLYNVLILPMRNGNASDLEEFNNVTLRSYPTYEEWKPAFPVFLSSTFPSSYPTYEEWKLEYIYYTYKLYTVLILPMRNGNELKLRNKKKI